MRTLHYSKPLQQCSSRSQPAQLQLLMAAPLQHQHQS
jgi:hypothetical protein